MDFNCIHTTNIYFNTANISQGRVLDLIIKLSIHKQGFRTISDVAFMF